MRVLVSSMLSEGKTAQNSPGIEATAILSIIATAATTIFSYLSLLGYVFLVRYYEHFGIRYTDVISGIEHFFLRGFDITVGNPILLSSFLVVVVLFGSIFWTARNGSNPFRLRLLLLCVSLLGVATLTFSYTRPLSTKYAARDVFPLTTTFRQLYCIESANIPVKSFKEYAKVKKQKILVLARAPNQLILFLAPTIVAGTPRVKTISIELSDGDLVQQTSASTSGWGNDGTLDCFR